MEKVTFNRFYWPLFFVTIAISVFGIFAIYSATAEGSASEFAVKQLVWLVAGLSAMGIVLLIGYKPFLNMSYLIYAAGLMMLLAVLVMGPIRGGAQRWISIGPFILQPSEFIKIVLIVTLAHYLGNSEKNLSQLSRFFVSFFITIVPMVLVLKQPDLGTSLIFLPILFTMLFVWGAQKRFFFTTFGLGLVSMPFMWSILKDYQRRRLLTFINPDLDPLGAGYTAIQSKIAVGSGGLFGKGYLSGSQNKLDFLPEHHTDFIFGVVGEELGFVGAAVLILLYALFIFLSVRVIRKTTDVRGKLLATGILAMLMCHILINIGMCIGLMPITGLPLPFMSYGGSSMLAFFIATGLLLSIYKERSIF